MSNILNGNLTPRTNLIGSLSSGGSGGTSNYNDLSNKPSINGVTLSGDKTTSDLGLFSGNYDDLLNKPTIPAAQVQSDYAQSDNTQVDYIKNKPDLSIYAKEAELILATGTENETPYQTRIAPSNIGNMALEKLVGVSVCFNQLVNTGDTSINTVNGHKYYTSINGTKSIISGGSAVSINDSSEDNVIDLTAMFGSSEVADYLYTLESGTAGSGVALFKSFFGKDYYPYTANTLMSCKPLAKVIKDSNNQTVATVNFSGTELRGILKVGTNGLYADGDIDDGSGTETVRYGIVDLGSLTWTYISASGHERMKATLAEWKRPSTANTKPNGICELAMISSNASYSHSAEGIAKENDSDSIFVYTSTMGTDANAFKTAMSGKYLIYELATPTTQTISAWTNPIVAKEGGTEEFTDSRTIKMPTGHDTIYSKKPNYRYWG